MKMENIFITDKKRNTEIDKICYIEKQENLK